MIHAKVTYVKGMQFVGEPSSGHAVVMDADTEAGGHDSGPRPMEMLLMGAGGCTGMDVISILKKKRQHVTGLEIQVKGKKAEDFPKKFTEITIEFIIRGKNIAEEAVRRSIELSMNKYCSVKATLEGTAKIRYSYKICND